MKIHFLEGDQPIAKRYELDAQGKLIKHPYPFTYEFTSHEEHIHDLPGLHTKITQHAARGHCLLKGDLARPLVKESRAGSTDRDSPSEWACLDIDGIGAYQSIDDLLDDLGCGDTDYIVQWSSSMGIESVSGFRCHVFALLSKPAHPQLLKQWLMHLNLTRPNIANQLQLTKTNNALRWPLDVTTCQNDKLIYIAPPIFASSIKDPFPGNRIQLVAKKNRYLALPAGIPSKDALRQASQDMLNSLREAQGLPKRRSVKYKFDGAVEYMVNPDSAVITGTKHERGFVYFNLNGGDSWGYYHPEDNAKFIYNFKGEPTYRTEDLLPEYWAELAQQARAGKPDSQGRVYLAFREFDSANYWNGWYDTANDELTLAMAKSEKQLRDFMSQHARPLGDFIPDWTLEFDPHKNWRVDVQTQRVNTYHPSHYFKKKPRSVKKLPPVADKIMFSAIGSDPAVYEHFLNWLACIFQFRDRTQTSWILQGTQGTGKGLLFHNILRPILGEQHCRAKRFEELESEFTDFVENTFVTMIDEVESGRSLYHSKITAKLLNLIVEPMVNVRRHYRPAYPVRNFNNMIFTSNKAAPIEVAPDDRRFNVGTYQPARLLVSSHEIDQLLPAELDDVYGYFMTRSADRNLARKPLSNQARAMLIDINRPAIDVVSDALLAGNLQFFWDQLPSSKDTMGQGPGLNSFKLTAFRNLVVELVNTMDTKLSRDDLYTLYDYCVGNMPTSPNKFTSILKHHRIHMDVVWKGNRSVRGIKVSWQPDAGWLAQAKQEIAQNAV